MRQGDIKIARSILAADLARLGEEVAEVERGGANVPVAGTSIFGDRQGAAAAMKRLQTAANKPLILKKNWSSQL